MRPTTSSLRSGIASETPRASPLPVRGSTAPKPATIFTSKGVVDGARRYNQYGGSQLNFDLIRPFTRATDFSDPHHAVRTWVVTLAYLLTDYRYLYF